MSRRRWKVAGINFDHFHMGDLLRMVHDHPDADLVAICDEHPERMEEARSAFSIPTDRVYTDHVKCLADTEPDVVVLCPAAARHAEWTEKVAPSGAHIIMEKPFAASLEEADRMIAAMEASGKQLAINWPLRWMRSHFRAWQLVREGLIGEVREVHYHGGNRGPLYHGADKTDREPTAQEKDASWFYKRAEGGGSLQDYLGYGATLGTWFLDHRRPLEVTAVVDGTPGLEVDEHCIAIARYDFGLSKFETRWGTFTDPWTHQPQPVCGFILKGTDGTISSPDYAENVRVQTRDCPEGRMIDAPPLQAPERNPIEYFLRVLETGEPITGPLSVEVSRIGQQIVDAAARSAEEKRTVRLVG